MAVPTITTITPTVGHSGGKTLVEVAGTGFALPAPPAPTGRVTVTPKPSVRVMFGTRAATEVYVVSTSLLYCQTPKGDPGDPVDVVLSNNDAAGDAVPGETVTEAAAFTFERPNLDGPEGEIARVIRTLIVELERQVLPNVHFSTHTDYDAETGDLLNYTFVSKSPALIIGNLDVPDNHEQALEPEGDVAADAGFFVRRRPPARVDLTATLVGVDATDGAPIRILNLMEAVRSFFQKNPYLEVDAIGGTIAYDMRFAFAGPVAVQHNGDNVESFAGNIMIRNVPINDMPGISTSKPSRVPAELPHEGTVAIGGVSASDGSAVVTEVQKKT